MLRNCSDYLTAEQVTDLLSQFVTRIYATWSVRPATDLIRIKPSIVKPLARYLTGERLRRAKQIVARWAESGTEPFPLAVWTNSPGNSTRVIFPPIVELHTEHGPCLIDGLHRFIASRCMRGDADIQCIGVDGGALPALPSEPWGWEQVELVPQERPLDQNLQSLKLNFFRPATAIANEAFLNIGSERPFLTFKQL